MYEVNPTLNGRYKKTFALKIDAVEYLEKISGYEMDKVYKGIKFVADPIIGNTVAFKPDAIIRAEFSEYDWELIGKLTEV